MPQHDYNIANGTGLQVRTELNTGLIPAIVTQNSGTTAPSPTFPYMRWADTATGMMKMMNGANDAWITLYQLDGEWNSLAVENGSVTAPSIYFKGSGTDTGIYSSDTDFVDIATGGVRRFSASQYGVSIPANDLTVWDMTVGRGGNGAAASNTAIGRLAMQASSTSTNNTAIGASALRFNPSGSLNTAVGSGSLNNCLSSGNTAVGGSSMLSLSTGTANTGVGNAVLYLNTSGSYNTALGTGAAGSLASGSGNIAIGPTNASGTYSPVYNITDQNNRIAMGSTAVTDAYIQVAWTVVSDARDKTNFAPVPHGLMFVNQLQPTAFQFKLDRDSEEPNGPLRYGFKAQDILELEGENSVIIDNEDPEKLRYKGEGLVPVLVNAINELTSMVKDLQAEVAELRSA